MVVFLNKASEMSGLYPQTHSTAITDPNLALQELVTALSTLQILGSLIPRAHLEKDTVITPIVQMRKLKSQRLTYIPKFKHFRC